MDYWRVLLKRKKILIATVVGTTALSVLYALFLPNIYRAKVTLMPSGGTTAGVGMLAQLGTIGGSLGSLIGGRAVTSSAVQLQTILASQTFAERIIRKKGWMKFFFKDQWDETVGDWRDKDPKKMPTIEMGIEYLFSILFVEETQKQAVMEISVELQDPVFAAVVVNACVEELGIYLVENAFTASKRNRIFVENQLERNKVELLEAGKELASFYQKNRVSSISPTVDVDISISEKVEEEAVEHDIRNTGAHVTHPEPLFPVVGAAFAEAKKSSEILQEKVEDLSEKINEVRVVEKVPQQVYLQYLTLRRELLGQVNSLLSQQYEMAKIEEAKEDLNFTVIDWARVPQRKFKPKRRSIVMGSFAASLFFGVLLSFFMEFILREREKTKKRPIR